MKWSLATSRVREELIVVIIDSRATIVIAVILSHVSLQQSRFYCAMSNSVRTMFPSTWFKIGRRALALIQHI